MNIALIILGGAFILVVVLMMVSQVKAASAKPAMETPTGLPTTPFPVSKQAGEYTSLQRPRDDTLSDVAFQSSPKPSLIGSTLTALPVPQTTGANWPSELESTTQPTLSTSAPATHPFLNSSTPYPTNWDTPRHDLVGLRLLSRDPVGLKLLARDPVGLKLLARDPVGLKLLARDPVGLKLLARDPVRLKLLARDPVGLRLLARD